MAAGVTMTVAFAMAAPDGSVTCPRRVPEVARTVAVGPAAVCDTASVAHNVAHNKARTIGANTRDTYELHSTIPFHDIILRYKFGVTADRKTKLRTPSVAGGATQVPGRKHHGLAGVGRCLQNGLDAADQLDRSAYASSTLGRDQNHGITFVQVGER